MASLFESRGVSTVRDLLFFFPRAYEDRSKIVTVDELQEGVKASVHLEVVSARKIFTRAKGRNLFEVNARDGSNRTIVLKWFYLPKGYDQKFQPGLSITATGTPKQYMGRMEIIHPEITFGTGVGALAPATPPAPQKPGPGGGVVVKKTFATPAAPAEDPLHVGRVVPIYTEIDGVTTRVLRRILWDAIEASKGSLGDDLPARIREKHGFPLLEECVREIHFPTKESIPIQNLLDFETPYHSRLIFEEFLKFELLVLRRRLQMEKEVAAPIGLTTGAQSVADFEKLLPFKLTGDQRKALDEILKDLRETHPMNRLVQGDVGSGKTAVALLSAVAAIAEGHQAAIMAPTEILAEQHVRNARKLYGDKIPVYLLTGKTKTAEHREILAKLSSGEPCLVIGTHALIEEPVKFRSLSLVMIDEQHRFGVEQRKALKEKGIHLDREIGRVVHPHFLVLTATPIPRTLALTVYGDLSVSLIREMPPGRQPIQTKVIKSAGRSKALEFIRKELHAGRQAYFIFPLVEASEAEGFQSLKSATDAAAQLQHETFPEFKVGLLHGQMKGDEKEAVMTGFKNNEFQVLVSTTVVEVGVDVPNATVICVEHAERFGLSQLHQLRGRVGRGQHASFCFLFSHPKTSETTDERLSVLEKSSDGFEISEADLKIRGPGEFLGTRQSGALPFKIADLVRDQKLLFTARDEALELLKVDPDFKLPENKTLRDYLEREGAISSGLLKTS